MLRKEILDGIWKEFHNEPAWLSKAIEFFGLNQDDEDYLNDVDSSYQKNIKVMSAEWKRSTAERVAQFVQERQGENPIWCRKRRMEYLRNHPDPRNSREMRGLAAGVSDKLDQSKIDRARSVSLQSLVGESLVHGRMPCPIHKGTDRNFGIKNGIGHCFVCGENLDAIGYMMKVRGLSFRSAVEALQNAQTID